MPPMENIPEIKPKGVELYDPTDTSAERTLIYDGVRSAFASQFPMQFRNFALDVEDLDYVDPDDYSLDEQKSALLNNRYLGRRLRGTLILKDSETGEVLDKKKTSLMRVPFYSQRGTYVHGGNDYAPINQSRLLPGIYTRKKSSGELEAQFNVRRGTGSMFRVEMDPATAVFRFRMKSSNLPLYSVLKAAGVDDDTLRKRWGDTIFDINHRMHSERNRNKALTLLKSTRPPTDETPVPPEEQVREALSSYEVHRAAVQRTLPGLLRVKQGSAVQQVLDNIAKKEPKRYDALATDQEEYERPGLDGILEASSKLLRVNRGEDELDDRDSWQFKRVYRPHDMLKEAVILDAGKLRRSLMYRAANTKNLQGVPPFYFDSYMTRSFLSTPLATPLEETNPLSLAEQWRRITMMGPGGVGDPNALTEEMQALHPSTFGFLSILSGPESEKAGVDVRLAQGARFGSDGKLYQRFLDRKTRQYRWLSQDDVSGLVMKLPD